MPKSAPGHSTSRSSESGEWSTTGLKRLRQAGFRCEIINGQIIVGAGATPRHQRLLKWLDRALEEVLPERHFSIAGVGVLTGEDVPIPDLIVATGDIPMDRPGVPAAQVILAVEIVSTATTMQDRMVKPLIYAEAGIPNYWRIEIDPCKGRLPGEELPVLFAYARGDDGEYQLTNRASAGTSVTFKSPFEFTVDPATLMR